MTDKSILERAKAFGINFGVCEAGVICDDTIYLYQLEAFLSSETAALIEEVGNATKAREYWRELAFDLETNKLPQISDALLNVTMEVQTLKAELQAAEAKIVMLTEILKESVSMVLYVSQFTSDDGETPVPEWYEGIEEAINTNQESSAKFIAVVKAEALEDAAVRIRAMYGHEAAASQLCDRIASELRGVGK
jgi:hypothetical protein